VNQSWHDWQPRSTDRFYISRDEVGDGARRTSFPVS